MQERRQLPREKRKPGDADRLSERNAKRRRRAFTEELDDEAINAEEDATEIEETILRQEAHALDH
jgi:hypothetical protein